jgi:rare lipoprotein A
MTASRLIMAFALLVVLAGCAGDSKRGSESDGPPDRTVKASDVEDAVPREEPRARYGNHSPYEVLGERYTVMASSEGYKKRGVASWYGSKFHGRRTSSGEVFDMYRATAAHRNLPLPTYAEITNLDNGLRVTVKINDRGPFHSERLIDLSYGAAVRLGMAEQGTARVEIRAIGKGVAAFEDQGAANGEGTFLQVGAFRERDAAEELAGRMMEKHLQPVSIQSGRDYHRVWLGPYESSSDIEDARQRAIELGLDRPHTVKR